MGDQDIGLAKRVSELERLSAQHRMVLGRVCSDVDDLRERRRHERVETPGPVVVERPSMSRLDDPVRTDLQADKDTQDLLFKLIGLLARDAEPDMSGKHDIVKWDAIERRFAEVGFRR